MSIRNHLQLSLGILFLVSLGFSEISTVYCQVTTDKKLTSREIAQRTLPSTVSLAMGNAGSAEIKTGSGFFVAEDIVATNFHVIEGTSRGFAKIYGQTAVYEVLGFVAIDRKNDLVLLRIKGVRAKPLPLNNDNSAAVGDDVYAIGNPEGLEGTFSQGIVSSIRKSLNIDLLQISAPISHGSSGG